MTEMSKIFPGWKGTLPFGGRINSGWFSMSTWLVGP